MRILIILTVIAMTNAKEYLPDWGDLNTRPVPEWYDNAKIGILLHWGVYSVPGLGSEWFWNDWKSTNKTNVVSYMNKNYPPGFTYQELAPQFTAELFDPKKWTDLFAASGAKSVIITSKHYDGYTLYPSKTSFSWNSVDVGPHRDIVGELSEAVREAGLKFGVYHSLFEWYNPLYLQDKANSFQTRDYVDTKLWPEMKQLVTDYQPDILRTNGEKEASDEYWKSKDFLAWLYSESPVIDTVVVNDDWGNIEDPKYRQSHGYKQYISGEDTQTLHSGKWERMILLDTKRSWSYRRDIQSNEVLSLSSLIAEIVSIVSSGGNALISLGPTKEGTIAPIFQERLLGLGEWLAINGEAIYNTRPWKSHKDSHNENVWYTYKKGNSHASDLNHVDILYATFLEWPSNNVLQISDIVYPNLFSDDGRMVSYRIELLGKERQYLACVLTADKASVILQDKPTSFANAWTLRMRLSWISEISQTV